MSNVGPILTIANGAGQGPGGPWNHLTATPGQRINIGGTGGTLLLSPPGAAPGAMSLTDMQSRVWHLLQEDPADSGTPSMQLADMQNRTWHLLREDGPDTGYPIPVTGDFNQTVVTRDLNIAVAQFLSQTGIGYVGNPIMVNQTDVCVLPPQYNMGAVYRVLEDYWLRKQDLQMAEIYGKRYEKEVERASRGQGNFTTTTLTRDLNIAIAQFISQTGIAPSLTERQDNFPVYPVADYPVPPGLVSLTRIEYTPSGQQTYKLQPKSFNEWDNVFGTVLPNDSGQPYYYRQPFAGYVRLQPQPGAGNYQGPGTGTITISGSPVVGEAVVASFGTTASSAPLFTVTYTVVNGDTTSTVAANLTTAINLNAVVTGTNALLQPAAASSNTITLTTIATPGTSVTYYAAVTGGTTLTVTPLTATAMGVSGDVITFYYSSLGIVLVNPLDVPSIPPQFHMAPVYRVLVDYWARKKDLNQAKHYLGLFELEVQRGKAYTFDMDRASSPSLDGDNYAETWPEGGG